MNVHRLALLVVSSVLCVPAGIVALEVIVGDAEIRRASELALRPESERARFHHAYEISVADSMVERLEVLTEFRRYVMEAERQSLLGNWMMARGGYDSSGRTIKDLLKEFRGQVAIRAHIRLHPLHTYSDVPPFDLALGEPPLLAVTTTRTPVTRGAREEGTSLVGAVIEKSFNAPSIGGATMPLVVLLDGKALARLEVNFSRFD